jgi:polysaccharide biosynthesis transport protein
MKSSTDRTPTHWWVSFRAQTRRYTTLLQRFWWVPVLATAIGFFISAVFIFRSKPLFVSNARMMVSGKISLPEGSVYSEELANFFGTQIELMRSGEVRQRAIARLAAMQPELQPVPVALEISQLPQTAIFDLRALGDAPEYTQKLLDAVMAEYIATKKEMRSEKSETTQSAIVDELARIEREIKSDEDTILEFQKQNNVGFLQEEGNSAGNYLLTLNKQLADLRTEFRLLDSLDIDQVLEQRSATTTADTGGTNRADQPGLLPDVGTPESDYLLAKQQLEVYKTQRDALAQNLRPKHPDLIEIEQKIAQQQSLVADYRKQSIERLKTRRDSVKLQIANLEAAIKEWDAKALALSQKIAQYDWLKSKIDRAKSAYDKLLTSLHNVDVSRSIDQDIVSILENASPAEPVRPGAVRIGLIGAGIGLLAGVLFIVLADQIDDRVMSLVDLEQAFSERLLAQIPREPHQGSLPLMVEGHERFGFAEAMRALRSSLLYLPIEGERPKTLLVTSAIPNEGKSTVVVNLAITMAYADVRVLLIDADLRRGALHTALGIEAEPGLADLLTDANQPAIIQTRIKGLHFLARGRAVRNPGELFLSERFGEFLRSVYPTYDTIILDSSPVLAADDTTSLAPKIDASLFVIRFGHSSARSSRKALALLRERQANVIGLVCNSVNIGSEEYYYYKYPQYYSPKLPAS